MNQCECPYKVGAIEGGVFEPSNLFETFAPTITHLYLDEYNRLVEKYKDEENFNLNGTNSPENPDSYDVEDTMLRFAEPTKEGYEFKGWYSDEACTEEFNKTAIGQTGDLTLYALWEKQPEDLDDSNNSDNSDDADNSGQDVPAEDNGPSDESVPTGDHTPYAGVICGMLMSMLAIGIAFARKKRV